MIGPVIARFRAWSSWHRAAALFLLVLFIALAVRAADDERWSDWGFGDAQTMLSLRQWEEGGWIENFLLFKPQGYAKAIEVLDDPDLRHHAHGTCPGSSPRVGPRLWYTHYPAGYLVPYAAMFRLGLDSPFAVRLLSLLFSFGALLLMYLLFARITSPRVSFIAVLFYGLSSSFLGYADSLANQPVDDLLRFGFLFAVVMTTRAAEAAHRRRWMIAAWAIEFALSLTSFDSVFFVFVWLVGWDLLEKRGFRWKTYLVFGLAPVTAHGLQFLQNVWYLGWGDALIDIKDAFLLKHGSDTAYNVGQGRLGVILESIGILFGNLYSPAWMVAAVFIVYFAYRRLLSGDDRELPGPALLALLFLCGLAFVLVLPHAARMPYEARQMIPFAALLAGGLFWSFVKTFVATLHGSGVAGRTAGTGLVVSYLAVAAVLLLVFWFRFAFSDRRPVYAIRPEMTDIPFARELKEMPTRYEPVYLDVGGFRMFWDPNYVPGYPQILPLTEYYAGSRPILCFTDAGKMAADLVLLMRKNRERFSPVLVAGSAESVQEVIAYLRREGALRAMPPAPLLAGDRFVLDLTDHLDWGNR